LGRESAWILSSSVVTASSFANDKCHFAKIKAKKESAVGHISTVVVTSDVAAVKS